jgi:GxxExxY protein
VNLDTQELPHIVVSACLEVHKQLGPHLFVQAYKECLSQELAMREILFDREVPVEILYKGRRVPSAFTFDFIIEHQIVLDIECFPEGDLSLKDRNKERLNSLLRLSGYEIAMLVNFHAADLRNGIKRLIVSGSEPILHYR